MAIVHEVFGPFIGREIDCHDPQAWFARLSLPVRRQITDCEVYEYVEIMP